MSLAQFSRIEMGPRCAHLVGMTILAGAVVFLSDIPNAAGVAFWVARGTLLVLASATLLLPPPQATVLLILILVGGQDIVSTRPEVTTASLWQAGIGPVNPSWLVFGLLGAHALRRQRLRFPHHVRWIVAWFAFVPLLASLWYGGIGTEHATVEVVKDLKYVAMPVAALLVFLTLFSRGAATARLATSALLTVLAVRHMVDLGYTLAGHGPEIIPGVSRGSLDSAKGGVVLLTFVGLTLAAEGRHRMPALAMAAASVVLLVLYATRMLWVTLLLGLLVLLWLTPLRKGVAAALFALSLALAGLVLTARTRPAIVDVAVGRAATITTGRSFDRFAVGTAYNPISRIDPVRYAEFLNLSEDLTRRSAWLWGTGYGGFYRDRVVRFPSSLESSFPDYSLRSRQYYWAHSFLTYNVLKYGLLGTLVIAMYWLLPARRLVQALRVDGGTRYRWLAISLLAFLPTAVLQLYWSGKGLLFNGLIVAIMVWLAHDRLLGRPPRSGPISGSA